MYISNQKTNTYEPWSLLFNDPKMKLRCKTFKYYTVIFLSEKSICLIHSVVFQSEILSRTCWTHTINQSVMQQNCYNKPCPSQRTVNKLDVSSREQTTSYYYSHLNGDDARNRNFPCPTLIGVGTMKYDANNIPLKSSGIVAACALKWNITFYLKRRKRDHFC